MGIASRARTAYQSTYRAFQQVCDHYPVHALGRRADRRMLGKPSAIWHERELPRIFDSYPKTFLDDQGCPIPQELNQSLRAL